MHTITINVNGEEKALEFDILNADHAGRFEKAQAALSADAQAMQAKQKSKGANPTLEQVIRDQCGLLFEFFNACVGNGTEKFLFGEEVSLRVASKAYRDFVDRITSDKDGVINAIPV